MKLVVALTVIIAVNYFAACCGCYDQGDIVMNNNQPPAPPAGHMNTNVLPHPPKPHSPSVPEPPGAGPQRAARGEPKAQVTHVLMMNGWIPVDKDSLGSSPEMILEKEFTVTFMSEGKQISCRSLAILATKTKYT